MKIYNSFDLSEANRRKLSEILNEFDNFATGETNETYINATFSTAMTRKMMNLLMQK